jgi:hypothetical protein
VPLQLGSRTAVLAGVISIDDTESLAGWLRTRGSARIPARINLGDCTHLHTAALQALLAARVQVSVPPTDPFLLAWVAPLLGSPPHRHDHATSQDSTTQDSTIQDSTAQNTLSDSVVPTHNAAKEGSS